MNDGTRRDKLHGRRFGVWEHQKYVCRRNSVRCSDSFEHFATSSRVPLRFVFWFVPFLFCVFLFFFGVVLLSPKPQLVHHPLVIRVIDSLRLVLSRRFIKEAPALAFGIGFGIGFRVWCSSFRLAFYFSSPVSNDNNRKCRTKISHQE